MGSAPLKGKTSPDGSMTDDDPSSGSRGSENGESTGVFQAGGHGKLSKDPGQEGAIRKVANDAEILFYQTLNGDDPQLETIPEHIRSFFPKFYGVSDKKFIVLQDLTHNVKKACVMDIKMGTKTYTSDSNMIKKWMLESKDQKTTTASLGFRVTGFRSFKRPSGEFDVKGRPWGMALTPDDIVENLSTFFDDGERSRLDVLEKYIARLEILLPWYSEQSMIKIFSSSLLFVYDSDGDANMADVHMIDFAHVKRIESPDDRDHGYVAGLTSLIDIFKQIRNAKQSTQTEKVDGAKDDEQKHHHSNVPHLEIPTEEGEKKKKRKSMSKDSPTVSEASAGSTPEPELAKSPRKHHHRHHSKDLSAEATNEEDATTPTKRKSAKRHKTPRTPTPAE